MSIDSNVKHPEAICVAEETQGVANDMNKSDYLMRLISKSIVGDCEEIKSMSLAMISIAVGDS